jgi:glycosyltransferase involved in cell wall biosynthesis
VSESAIRNPRAGVRVVRVIARLNMGGPARHVVWLNAGLRQSGFESVLITGTVPPGEDDITSFAVDQGVEPVVIPEMSREIALKDLITIWKLYRLLVRLRPDVVHTHTAKAGTVGRLAGWLYRWLTPAALLGRPRRCRIVHTYHGHIFHSYYGRLKTRLFLGIEKLLARLMTDRIVVISAQQYQEIHERFGVGRAGQFVIVPLGLDLGSFANGSSHRERVRKELGLKSGETAIGIVGRLTEIKNHRLFLEAVALFRRRANASGNRNRPVRFLVIGSGHLRHDLESQARALDLTEVVTFLGKRDDPESFYPALDGVALTSRNEGTPLTLIEAMANRRAVIATDVGGVVDLLGSPRADTPNHAEGYAVCERGILVRPNDAAAYCRGLERLIDDAALRDDLGERGLHYVHTHHSRDRLVTDMVKLYEDLASRGPSGAVERPRHPSGIEPGSGAEPSIPPPGSLIPVME